MEYCLFDLTKIPVIYRCSPFVGYTWFFRRTLQKQVTRICRLFRSLMISWFFFLYTPPFLARSLFCVFFSFFLSTSFQQLFLCTPTFSGQVAFLHDFCFCFFHLVPTKWCILCACLWLQPIVSFFRLIGRKPGFRACEEAFDGRRKGRRRRSGEGRGTHFINTLVEIHNMLQWWRFQTRRRNQFFWR